VLFVNAFAQMTEYRAEIVIWMIGGSLPLIMMLIWMGLAEAGPVGGYGPADFAAYFLLVFFVRQMTAVWVVWDLDREIRLGELSPKLLRPLDPYWGHVAANLAEKVLRFPLTLLPVVFGLWLAGARLELDLGTLMAFFLALAGAWLIRFNQQYSFGLVAFWKDQAVALEQVWFALYFAFAGTLAPLDLFPEGLQRFLVWTPFPYMLDFPARILLGSVTGAALWQGLAAQGAWALLFVLLRLVLWRKGLERYGAVGA
jgi:ABC-2 type transport system permease protein